MPQVKMVKSIAPVKRKDGKGIYHKVIWADDTFDSVFSPDILKVMEEALADNKAVQLVKEKNDRGFLNITEAKIVTAEDLPEPKELPKYPQDAPESKSKPVEEPKSTIIPIVDKRSQEIETNMWWKIVSDSLGNGVIDRKTPIGKTIERVFKTKMLDVLGIKVETKQNPTSEPEGNEQ